MALIQKNNPINEDLAIAKIQEQLFNNLVANGITNYESYERVYLIDKVPHLYVGNGNYKEVFFDDRFSLTSFFLVGEKKTLNNLDDFSVDLSIIFQVKLNEIYPNATHRMDTEFHSLVKRALENCLVSIELIEIVTGIDNVYEGLTFENSQFLDDVSFFHLVRFNYTLNYHESCSKFIPFACADANYIVQYLNGTLIEQGTISSGGNKTIQVPNPSAAINYNITDSLGTTLYSGTTTTDILQTIQDATANVVDSALTLITSVQITAEGVAQIVVNDSVISNSDASFSQNVKATQNLILPDVRIEKSDNSLIQLIPSVKDFVVNDSVISINSNSFANVKATDPLNVPVKYANGTDIGSNVGGVWTIPNPIIQGGIAYCRPQLTGQTTIYNNFDDGWQRANGTYDYTPPSNPIHTAALVDFFTLKNNNFFGNTNRFTDINGLQIYANNYVIDNYTGLGWYRLEFGVNTLWATNLVDANASNIGMFSGWRMASAQEIYTLHKLFNAVGVAPLNFAPFNLTGNPIGILQTSTTHTFDVDAYYRMNITTNHSTTRDQKTLIATSRATLICRNHFN